MWLRPEHAAEHQQTVPLLLGRIGPWLPTHLSTPQLLLNAGHVQLNTNTVTPSTPSSRRLSLRACTALLSRRLSSCVGCAS